MKIGQRVKQLRQASGITPTRLESHSKISRSYLWYVERNEMIPSLWMLERFGNALGIGLIRFFRETPGELLLEDHFVRRVCPLVRRLNQDQREKILKTVQAIGS